MSGQDNSLPPWQVVAVLGPTATGKSAFAMALAADLAARGRVVELIGADALQAYRGFSIGTAKPGPRARTRVRHHLIDVVEPHEAFSAGEFARRAAVAVAEIEGRGALPILVGGSGLYLRALFEGLAPVPRVDAEVREALRAELRTRGLCALVEELRRVDPRSAETLAPGDTQRVLRALEVARATGTPLSEWQRRGTLGRLDRRLLKVGLTLPRAVLYDAVEKRAKRMLERGWLAEVERLRAEARVREGRSLRELPAVQAIGYRPLMDHLDGNMTLEQALEETVRATRRYAKRQETWFRKEPGVLWTDPSKPGEAKRLRRRIVDALMGAAPSEAALFEAGPFEAGP